MLSNKLELVSFVLTHIKYVLSCNLHDALDNLWQAFKPEQRGRFTYDQKKRNISTTINQMEAENTTFTNGQWKKVTEFLNKTVWPWSKITHYDVILADCSPNKSQVISFLKRLRIFHSEKNSAETERDIKQKLLSRYGQGSDAVDVLYYAFLHYFIVWLGSYEARLIKSQEIKNLFEEWQGRLIQLQRWIGISSVYQASLITDIDSIRIDRNDILEKIESFRVSLNRFLVIFGDRGVGKSSIICQYINKPGRYDSDCLIFDINIILNKLSQEYQRNDCSFKYFTSCQIIFIENFEDILTYPESIVKLFGALISSSARNIRFVFTSRDHNLPIDIKLLGATAEMIEFLEVPKLSKQVVVETFPYLLELFDPEKLVTLYPKNQPNVLLEYLGCHPFYLKLLVSYYKKYGKLSINYSSTDDFINIVLEFLLSKQQLSVIRRLIYLLSQQKETKILSISNESELLELIKIQILVKTEAGYQFSHKLYEEWAVRVAIELRLISMLESNDEIYHIYQEMIRILPSHKKAVYIYLGNNNSLRSYRLLHKNENPDRPFLENNNIYFLKYAILNQKSNVYINETVLLYVLVDSDPEALLRQLSDMIDIPVVRCCLLNNDGFRRAFYTAFIRSFCTAENILETGKSFYHILQKLDANRISDSNNLSYYMEHIFINAFAGTNSMGLMSLNAKLQFMRTHFEQININSSFEDQCYFQYIYDALIKASDPGESGESSYPEQRCYFVNEYGNLDGYTNYEVKFSSFSIENINEQTHYHCHAMTVLVQYYNNDNCCDLRDSETALNDIMKLSENSINGSVTYNGLTHLMYIIDVAAVIAANVKLDDQLIGRLNEIIDSGIKSANNYFEKSQAYAKDFHYSAVSQVFDPSQSYKLKKQHLDRLKDILEWRKMNEYKVYITADINFLISELSVNKKLYADHEDESIINTATSLSSLSVSPLSCPDNSANQSSLPLQSTQTVAPWPKAPPSKNQFDSSSNFYAAPININVNVAKPPATITAVVDNFNSNPSDTESTPSKKTPN